MFFRVCEGKAVKRERERGVGSCEHMACAKPFGVLAFPHIYRGRTRCATCLFQYDSKPQDSSSIQSDMGCRFPPQIPDSSDPSFPSQSRLCYVDC